MKRADWVIYGFIIGMAVVGVAILSALGDPYIAGLTAGALCALAATHAAAMTTRAALADPETETDRSEDRDA